jgi:hypothetical protein
MTHILKSADFISSPNQKESLKQIQYSTDALRVYPEAMEID